jgi:S-adenosylmethionine synthetase
MVRFEVAEGIAQGHPDKVADQISDAILDECLKNDPASRVAVETLVSHNLVAVGGEISSSAKPDIHAIVRNVLTQIGYNDSVFGDVLSRLRVVTSICEQSPDISTSVGIRGDLSSVAAGDQGTMYGYACTETETFMPKAYEIARSIVRKIRDLRASDPECLLGPDGKTQVAIDTNTMTDGSLVLSWQHAPSATLDDVRQIVRPIIEEACARFRFHPGILLINPSGRFVAGGPLADTGLTGRKQISDSYGSSVRHGGGAFSGKDATKVDRSGAYIARYVAKHVVAAELATRCEIQLIYSIGKAKPLSVGVYCFGTEKVPLQTIEAAIHQVFDFSVGGIIKELRLTLPIFQSTAWGGHFGRDEFMWEKLPRLEALCKASAL